MPLLKKIMKWLLIVLGSVFLLSLIWPYFVPLNFPEQKFEKVFPESQYLDVEGTKVHYREYFPKDSVVGHVMLVHGFSGSGFSWRKNISMLTSLGLHTVAIDLPPFGYSDKSPEANVSDSMRNDYVLSVMNEVEKKHHFEKSPWFLFGHSMGGMVIGSFASEYPERVKALFFVDGICFTHDGKRPFYLRFLQFFLRWYPYRRAADVIMERSLSSYEKFKELLTSAYGAKPDSLEVEGYRQPFLVHRSASSVLLMSSRMGYAKIDMDLVKQFPTFLVWGTNDQWIPISSAHDFLKEVPQTMHYFVKGAGHCPMETHSDEFNLVVENWIKALIAPSSSTSPSPN